MALRHVDLGKQRTNKPTAPIPTGKKIYASKLTVENIFTVYVTVISFAFSVPNPNQILHRLLK
jgi:hypothetical protein